MFTNWLSKNTLKGKIMDYNSYKPYPKASEREKWDNLDDDYKAELIAEGEQYLGFDWPIIKATDFIEYSRSGNRIIYENPSFTRRRALASMVIAECVENKGRFLDEIINGVWLICEESFWGVSAHNFNNVYNLYDIENQYIDLFSAETATLLAHIIYLLGNEIDDVSIIVRRRIELELEERIKIPFLNRQDYRWMGFTTPRVNNWNPWIIGNVLNVFFFTEKDNVRRENAVKKSFICLEHFINSYKDDGGCDEGPNYWNVAGGALFDCLDQLYDVSNGEINLFEVPLVKEIGRFLYRTFIDKKYYVNFADGDAKVTISSFMVYRYGKRIDDQKLIDLAIYSNNIKNNSVQRNNASNSLKRYIPEIFGRKDFDKLTATPPYERDVWLNGIELVAARNQADSTSGLYFVAKGGNNAESHNHNDIGTFTVYKNAFPCFIDLGVETYTRFTFSEFRYDIWTMQSQYHNLPTINGAQQVAGADRMAENIKYSCSDDKVNFSVEIAGAYDNTAKINSYKREYSYFRGENNEIEITDNFDFINENNSLNMTFMTWKEPKLVQCGKINVALPTGDDISLDFDSEVFTDVNIEKIEIKDKRMKPTWEDFVYRISLKAENISSGKTTFVIK